MLLNLNRDPKYHHSEENFNLILFSLLLYLPKEPVKKPNVKYTESGHPLSFKLIN